MPGDSLLGLRDTDADWRELGKSQPYWGVITQPDYRTENLTPARLDAFYASGVAEIADIARRIAAVTGVTPQGRALDFGCGTGRLAEAMASYAQTIGCDISPGMLVEARKRGGKAHYVDTLPDGPFDWINSYIVFQHIPPERGLPLMETLLARLAPGGVVSLQVTVWREAYLQPPSPRGWRRLVHPLLGAMRIARVKRGAILMYDYNLSRIASLLNRAGIEDFHLVSTVHGGHHGVIILGRKTAESHQIPETP